MYWKIYNDCSSSRHDWEKYGSEYITYRTWNDFGKKEFLKLQFTYQDYVCSKCYSHKIELVKEEE